MLQLSSSIDPKKEKKKKTPIVVTTVLLTELPAHAARRRNFLSVFSCQGSYRVNSVSGKKISSQTSTMV